MESLHKAFRAEIAQLIATGNYAEGLASSDLRAGDPVAVVLGRLQPVAIPAAQGVVMFQTRKKPRTMLIRLLPSAKGRAGDVATGLAQITGGRKSYGTRQETYWDRVRRHEFNKVSEEALAIAAGIRRRYRAALLAFRKAAREDQAAQQMRNEPRRRIIRRKGQSSRDDETA
jgi:hypothetical protein